MPYDLTLRDAIDQRYFYCGRERWSFRTAKTLCGLLRSLQNAVADVGHVGARRRGSVNRRTGIDLKSLDRREWRSRARQGSCVNRVLFSDTSGTGGDHE